MIEIGWFSTGRGEGSLGLLCFVQERINRGLLDARIGFVFSNREPGEAEGSDRFFAQVRDYGLPLVTLSSAKFRRAQHRPFSEVREDYDRQVMGLLNPYQPDICVLAGYMLIFSGPMCRTYPMLNLHPALPDGPTGTWQDVVWDLIETRAAKTGAMMHLATEEVDRGPVVSYCTLPLTGQGFDAHWEGLKQADLQAVKETQGEEFPLFQVIRQAEYRREPYLLFETLRAVSQGRVLIEDGAVLQRGQTESDISGRLLGLCLDAEVERAMAADDAGAGC